jgi:hypothetical protein
MPSTAGEIALETVTTICWQASSWSWVCHNQTDPIVLQCAHFQQLITQEEAWLERLATYGLRM